MRADTVTDWNTNATKALIANGRPGPDVSTIHLEIVNGAVFDAVNFRSQHAATGRRATSHIDVPKRRTPCESL